MESLTNDGSDVIERQLDCSEAFDVSNKLLTIGPDGQFDMRDVLEQFDTSETAGILVEKGFSKVALQFSDELLQYSWVIVESIRTQVKRRKELTDSGDDGNEIHFCILGDTSYGSCCVDEVAAQHFRADFIVHYGFSCLSETARTPVQYVFGRLPMNIEEMVDRCVDIVDDRDLDIILLRDVRYNWKIEELADALRKRWPCKVTVPTLPTRFQPTNSLPDSTPPIDKDEAAQTILGQKFLWPDESDKTIIIYIGGDGKTLSQAALQAGPNRCRNIFAVDPATSFGPIIASVAGSRLLTKRFLKVQQARDARVFGILVGTMGVRGYSDVLRRLERVIKQKGRKSYTFVMGKINPAKLANFPQVDVYILVACPLNSLIDDKDFLQPVVTPLELLISLELQDWNISEYSCSFDRVNQIEETDVDETEDDNVPHFSAVTGQLVSDVRVFTSTSKEPSDVISVSSGKEIHSFENRVAIRYTSPAGDFLETQTFRGLDSTTGDKKPSPAVLGQTGTAMGLSYLEKDSSSGSKAVEMNKV